jgi:hypothetical protein
MPIVASSCKPKKNKKPHYKWLCNADIYGAL